MIYSNGTYTLIDHPTDSFPTFYDINDAGKIVGTTLGAGFESGFTYENGTFTPFSYRGNSVPLSINASGDIAGTYDFGRTRHGFVIRNGTGSDIDVPNFETYATGISDPGQVVGYYTGSTGYSYADGQFITSFQYPGAKITQPNGINDSGTIAGAYVTGFQPVATGGHGFVFSNGVYSSIDFPGAVSTTIRDINNSGQIVGTYTDGTKTMGFIASRISLRNDLNGDAKADLVFQNGDGTVGVWSMYDATVRAAEAVSGANAPPGWMVKGTGDLNGDLKADMLLQNSATGAIAVWAMDGSSVLATAALPVAPGPDWALLGSGDLNGDGKGDLVFQNSATRVVAVWLMDGATTISAAPIIDAYAPPDWAVRGIGDLNGDGMDDLALQNSSNGAVAVWTISGIAPLATAVLPIATGPDWHLVGTGDLNGDGKADLAFQNSITNKVSGWLMDGSSILTTGVISGAEAPPEYTLQGVEDLNGDGKDDQTFHSTDGSVAVWLMDGLAAASTAVLGVNFGPSWRLVGGEPGDTTSAFGAGQASPSETSASGANAQPSAAMLLDPSPRSDQPYTKLCCGWDP